MRENKCGLWNESQSHLTAKYAKESQSSQRKEYEELTQSCTELHKGTQGRE